LCTQNVDVPPGRVVYTLMLNRRGTVESELTVVRLDLDTFYLVTATAQVLRDFDWIFRHLPAEARPQLTDVTRSYGVLGIMGPRSRDLLSLVADVPLDNQSFPFGTAQEMTIAGVTLRALRVSYVGELGWELHIPSEQMRQVYDALSQRRGVVGLVNVGHYAVNSLRLEK